MMWKAYSISSPIDLVPTLSDALLFTFPANPKKSVSATRNTTTTIGMTTKYFDAHSLRTCL